MIRHRACTLRDTAYALIKAEMDTDFEEQCQEISRNRKLRHTKTNPHVEPASVEPCDPKTAQNDAVVKVRVFLRISSSIAKFNYRLV